MNKITAAITGVAGYLPDYVLSNHELEKMVDTTNDWIKSRTGIDERRLLKGEGQGVSVMATKAVETLLAKTNTKAEEIDLLIVATVTGDFNFPATANIVAANIGATNAWSYDISAACSGFLYALTTGSSFIESGRYKKVIIVGADKMSSIIDYTDRATCIIFGDGAGAVMLEPSKDENGIIDAVLKSDGNGKQFLFQKAGGSAYPANEETVKNKEHFVYQEGKTVFKFAVAKMAEVSVEIMERNNLSSEDVQWLVPHQANLRIIDATRERMGLPEEKVMINIQKYGNTTAATLPLCLRDWENKLKKGDNIILAAFGGGFTWGSIYLKWAY